MRDLIWTVIVIWLVWKIYDMFKRIPKKVNNNTSNTKHRKEGEVKVETARKQKNFFDKDDGEYVDYEEVK